MRARSFLRIAVLALVVLGESASIPAANDASFIVIVHPDNRVDSVDRELLRDAYLGKATEWNGETIRPVNLSTRFAVRDQFTEAVLHKTPAQLRRYWAQQIFSGKGEPPPDRDSTTDVIAYVLANKGAVGYLPANAAPGRAKIVRIR